MKSLRLGAFALIGITLVACDDTTGPDTPFDPQSTAAAMESIAAATGDMDDAWGSISLAGGLFESTGTAALLPSDEGRLVPSSAAARRYADAVEAEAFFPQNYLGTTFVWSRQEDAYVESDEAGAPADGIRIIYYAIDPVFHTPAQPLTALGYVDLRDLSGASSEQLGIEVVHTGGSSDVTLADYYIDASYTATQSSVTAVFQSVGFLSNGADQLNFDLSQNVTFSETALQVEQDFRVGLDGTDISVRWQADAEGDWQGGSGVAGMTVTIENGVDTAVLDMTIDGDLVDGEIRHNGSAVALISGDAEEPTFTNMDGEPLEASDLEALHELFSSVQGLFELVAGIFGVVQGE